MNSNSSDNWTLRDIWDIFLGNIWIYILTCTIALTAAVAYIVVTPPMYERSASIIINEDDQDPMNQNFQDIGIFKSNTNINNEVRVLRTKAIMAEVVERLGLEYIYKEKKRNLRWVDVYNRTPFVVLPDNLMREVTFSFDIEFVDMQSYEISNLIINGLEIDVLQTKIGYIGKSFSTPYGSIVIESTPHLNEGCIAQNYMFTKARAMDVAKDYISRLRVSLSSDGTSVVNLSIMDERLERADNLLNTIIEVYNENWIRDKNEVKLNTSKFINGRLAVIESELESVDESIANYKSDELIPDISAVAGIQLQQNTQNSMAQLSIKNRLTMVRYIREQIGSISGDDKLLPANTGIDNSVIESQIEKYNELLLQRNLLVANNNESSPIVADMTIRLKSIKEIITTALSDYVRTLNIQLSNLQSQENINNTKLSSTPQQAKELLGVERQQMIKEQLFLYLLQKREENELSQAFSAYNTRIVSLSDGSSHPKEPKKSMVLMFALAVGVILPTLYVVAKEAFDTLIKSKKDLEGLNIPYIGSIPYIAAKKGKRGKKAATQQTVVSDNNRDLGNEAFRVLRTNLDFMVDNVKNDTPVIQTISLLAGSGKSFITANLALSMALKDAKVLILDCDIRKKTLSKYITNDKVYGISDYLNGRKTNIDELIIKDALNQNLDVLPAGTTPPNPSELLLKPRLGELINAMKERYDYIFIDCPPVEIIPDAAIVGKFCNTSIFVIRAESVDKRLLPEIETIYESKKYGSNMCMLLNGVKNRGRGYGYYGSRYYGYHGYGYGYGSESSDDNVVTL